LVLSLVQCNGCRRNRSSRSRRNRNNAHWSAAILRRLGSHILLSLIRLLRLLLKIGRIGRVGRWRTGSVFRLIFAGGRA
jgi:hypothetical protein